MPETKAGKTGPFQAFCFYGEKLLVSGIALRHGEAQVLLGVLAQLLEGFLAQIMLHLAGIGGGGFLAHAESYEKRSQRLVAAIDALGHLLPAFGKRDVAVLCRPVPFRYNRFPAGASWQC